MVLDAPDIMLVLDIILDPDIIMLVPLMDILPDTLAAIELAVLAPEAAAELAPEAPGQLAGATGDSFTLTVLQSWVATCNVCCTSDAEQALKTQQLMPLMKELSEQMHFTSRLQLAGRLAAQGF